MQCVFLLCHTKYLEYQKWWSKEKQDLEVVIICLQLYTSMLERNVACAEEGTGDKLKWNTQASVPIYAGSGSDHSRNIQGFVRDFQKEIS